MPGGDSGVAKNWARPLNCLSGKKAYLRQCSYNRTPSAQLMWSAGGKAGQGAKQGLLSQSPQSSVL